MTARPLSPQEGARSRSPQLVWFPDPSVMRMRGRGKKGLGNNYTLARARGWNLQKVLESISSRCNTNFCPQVVLATCTTVLYACLLVNIHDRVTQSANHSHFRGTCRSNSRAGPCGSIVISQTLLSPPAHAHN